jgi:hypothetical protein
MTYSVIRSPRRLGRSAVAERLGQMLLRSCQAVTSALGHKRTSLWKQLVRKTLHAAGHRCLDRGEIAPGRAWLGRDHLGPNNEEGRDRDEDNGQLLAHCSRFPLPAGLLGHRTRWGDVTVLASLRLTV